MRVHVGGGVAREQSGLVLIKRVSAMSGHHANVTDRCSVWSNVISCEVGFQLCVRVHVSALVVDRVDNGFSRSHGCQKVKFADDLASCGGGRFFLPMHLQH